MKNIYLKILKMAPDLSDPVLATVTNTVGSTPQKPGSSALFDNNRLITGTVGGGVVEGKLQEFAQICSHTKESGFFHYHLNKDISEQEEAICGGKITLLIDANPLVHLPVFKEVKKSMVDREPGVLITKITSLNEKAVLINRYWMTRNIKPVIPAPVMEKLEPEIMSILLSSDRDNYRQIEMSIPGEASSATIFLEPLFPMPKLIIAGAGHIGKALSLLGRMLDFEVTVIDNRREYANMDNIPDADHIIVKEIGEAMQEIEKVSDTYIVIVTRGHKDDGEALKPCIGSGAGYVGMIGSRGKVEKMHSEFIRMGWATEEQWSRIFTPIGLDIRSKTVEEIAMSIAAQLILVRNKRN